MLFSFQLKASIHVGFSVATFALPKLAIFRGKSPTCSSCAAELIATLGSTQSMRRRAAPCGSSTGAGGSPVSSGSSRGSTR